MVRLDQVLVATWRNSGATETKRGSSVELQPLELNGGADGIRTRGLVTASHARSQLRHSPTYPGLLAGTIRPGSEEVVTWIHPHYLLRLVETAWELVPYIKDGDPRLVLHRAQRGTPGQPLPL